MDNGKCRLLIKLYGCKGLLWNSKCPDYHNKSLREDAWKDISAEMVIPIPELKKKMTTLQASYRREKSRIAKSLITGSGIHDVYVSKWFAFDDFDFMKDKDVPNPTSDTMPEDEHNAAEHSTSTESCRESRRGPTTSLSSLTPKQPPPKKRKHLGSIARQNELLKLACDFLSNGANDSKEADDEYQDIVKVWANKLKALDPLQRRYAERAINEVLFEAESGTLHRNSVQINQGTLSVLTSPSKSDYSSAHGTNVRMPSVPMSVHPTILNSSH